MDSQGEILGGQAQFNQAAYSMLRLNDRFQETQNLFKNPLYFDETIRSYNYEIILQSQIQILLEISPKLRDSEKKEGIELRNKLLELVNEKKIFSNTSRLTGYRKISSKKNLNVKNWTELQKKLYDFSGFLFEHMEKHGLGNPSKNVAEAIQQ